VVRKRLGRVIRTSIPWRRGHTTAGRAAVPHHSRGPHQSIKAATGQCQSRCRPAGGSVGTKRSGAAEASWTRYSRSERRYLLLTVGSRIERDCTARPGAWAVGDECFQQGERLTRQLYHRPSEQLCIWSARVRTTGRGTLIHMDGASDRRSKVALDHLKEVNFRLVLQFPISSDLAPTYLG
jgi:hypothetical protein